MRQDFTTTEKQDQKVNRREKYLIHTKKEQKENITYLFRTDNPGKYTMHTNSPEERQ